MNEPAAGTGPVRPTPGAPEPGWSPTPGGSPDRGESPARWSPERGGSPGWAPYPGSPPVPEPVAGTQPRRWLVPLLIAGAAVAFGAPFGLVWAAFAPRVPLRLTEAGLVYAEAQPEQVVAADGWYAVLALPFGLLLGVGAWLAGRRARGVPTLVALAVGALGAGLLAWWLGSRIGLAGYQASVAAAGPGTVVDRPADLSMAEVGWWPPRVTGVPVIPALAAAVTYTLLAAWSRLPTLRPDPDRSHPGPASSSGLPGP